MQISTTASSTISRKAENSITRTMSEDIKNRRRYLAEDIKRDRYLGVQRNSNEPCASNDVEKFALTQAMFDETTGELEKPFNIMLDPCFDSNLLGSSGDGAAMSMSTVSPDESSQTDGTADGEDEQPEGGTSEPPTNTEDEQTSDTSASTTDEGSEPDVSETKPNEESWEPEASETELGEETGEEGEQTGETSTGETAPDEESGEDNEQEEDEAFDEEQSEEEQGEGNSDSDANASTVTTDEESGEQDEVGDKQGEGEEDKAFDEEQSEEEQGEEGGNTTADANASTATTEEEAQQDEDKGMAEEDGGTTSQEAGAPDATETETPTNTAEDVAEEPKSFYSCSGGSGGELAQPSNTKELTITYDYELHTSSPLNDDMLSSFENTIARDLANGFGLVNCDGPTRRHYLRSLNQGEVVALSSEPVDDSLSGKCTPAQTNLSCTPMRGYMTAWLPPQSSNTESVEVQLLTLIEDGMADDSYTNSDVVKAVYVGERDDGASDGAIVADDAGAGTGNDASPDMGSTTNNAVAAKGTETNELEAESGPPLLAIGLSLFFIAFAMAIFLGVYIRRKRRSQYFTDGPNDMGNSNSLAAQAALANNDHQPEADPEDDIHLLPTHDKMDMRSVYSDETESYNYDDYQKNKEATTPSKYGNLTGGQYGDGGADIFNTLTSTTMDYGDQGENNENTTTKSGNGHVGGAGSSLAAMGVASTLAARSYEAVSPTSSSDDTPTSPEEGPLSPTDTGITENAAEDPLSPADWSMESQTGVVSPLETPGALSEDPNSHVGTVTEEEEQEETTSMLEEGESSSTAAAGVPSLGSQDASLEEEEDTSLEEGNYVV